ncbi:steroidogenic acute regulatory protein, mitochondrial-like [Bufo gargarizans]|uniref:steroidogenic acute regulatory protein, mitochondrial-like n=1 Tax=Bufo gargarizans TaxID=30331 RepID=UPI001CF30C8B|nr:steroidogenic acute regulatory protein, mitochondrial-like [Bufo gargarizans]
MVWYGRYIDDMLLIWSGDVSAIPDFVEYLQLQEKVARLQRPAVDAFGKEISKLILKTPSSFPNIPVSLKKMLCTKLGMNTAHDVRDTEMLTSQELFYFSQVEDKLQKAMCMLQQDDWQTETRQGNDDWIVSKTFPRMGKVFRAEAVIDSSPEHIYTQLFEKLDQMDQWNPNISKVQILQQIGKNTLLTREITAQIPANMVSQRDFVSVRHCYRKGSSLYIIGTAIDSQLMPPQKGIIRAEAGLTCIVLRPIDGDSGKTHFTWLLSLDLKGWIPQSVTDQALSRSQADFIKHLRRHLSSKENIFQHVKATP